MTERHPFVVYLVKDNCLDTYYSISLRRREMGDASADFSQLLPMSHMVSEQMVYILRRHV